jgi:hypothetical protein
MRRALCRITFVLAIAAAAFAQSRTTGALSGRVEDTEDSPIAGAVVQIAGSALLGGPRSASADAQGRFHFPELPPGRYEVTATAGVRKSPRMNVAVSVGLSSDVVLEVLPLGGSEKIDVRANEAPLDTETSSMPSILPQSFLRNVPTDREMSHILDLAPGIINESAYGGGEESGNAYQIDGVDVSDPQGGAPWSLFNYSVIQEAELVGLGAPAEYGQFTGAVFNAVTKSGGNEIDGHAESFYSGQYLTGNSTLEDLRPSIDAYIENSFNLGGPLVKDRVWYFGSGHYLHINSNDGGPTQREITPRVFAKISAAAGSRSTAHMWLQWDRTKVTGANADQFTLREASNREDNPDLVGNLAWTTQQSANSVWNAGWSGYKGKQRLTPLGGLDTPGHFDAQTGVASINAREFAALNRSRNQVNASWTQDVLGVHELKFGTEIEHSLTHDRFGVPGNAFYSDNEGPATDPSTGKQSFYTLLTLGGGYDAKGTNQRVSLYAQDAWRVTQRLTLNPGVRIDLNRGKVAGSTVFKTNPIAPRLGLAFDLRGDGRTVLRAHYGRYYEALYSAFYYYTDPGAFAPLIKKRIFNGSGFTQTLATIPGQRYAIDPHIKQPRLDQYVIGADHQLGNSTVVSASLVHRRNSDLIETVSRDGIFVPVTGRVPTTGQVVTLYDYLNPETDVLIYTNPRGLKRTYDALILSANHRLTEKWMLASSIVRSRARGNIDNYGFDQFGTGGNTPFFDGHFLDTPNSLVNANGRLVHDTTNQVKLQATRLFPSKHLSLSADYTLQSGDTWTPRTTCLVMQNGQCHDFPQGPVLYFAEPRGSRRLPTLSTVDLRIEWEHAIWRGRRVKLDLDTFNLLNRTHATAVETLIGPNFGEPALGNFPRNVRLGVALGW